MTWQTMKLLNIDSFVYAVATSGFPYFHERCVMSGADSIDLHTAPAGREDDRRRYRYRMHCL